MATNAQFSAGRAPFETDRWLEAVQRQVSSLRFGVVQIVVHNSHVTQIDRTEHLRLDQPSPSSFSNPPDPWR